MDWNTGDWKNQGAEDLQFVARVVDDPLAELAVELALCCLAIEEHTGSLCSACTCQLGYHMTCSDGACEFCGCDSLYWICITCSKSRPIEAFINGSKECHYCEAIPPVKILGQSVVRMDKRGDSTIYDWSNLEGHNMQIAFKKERTKAAYDVLKELSE